MPVFKSDYVDILTTLLENSGDCKLCDINEITGQICDTLNACAWDIGVSKVKKHNKQRSPNNKPWFNKNCKISRTEYRRLKSLFKASKTEENKINLRNATKAYRRTISKKKLLVFFPQKGDLALS